MDMSSNLIYLLSAFLLPHLGILLLSLPLLLLSHHLLFPSAAHPISSFYSIYFLPCFVPSDFLASVLYCSSSACAASMLLPFAGAAALTNHVKCFGRTCTDNLSKVPSSVVRQVNWASSTFYKAVYEIMHAGSSISWHLCPIPVFFLPLILLRMYSPCPPCFSLHIPVRICIFHEQESQQVEYHWISMIRVGGKNW